MDEDQLIQKWLNDELTPFELEAFKQLKDYQFYMDIVDRAQHFKADSFSEVDDYETFKKRIKPVVSIKRKRRIQSWMKIASVFVVGFALYYLFFYNSNIEFQTFNGERISVELPDHSTVELNAMSTLNYNRSNWNSKREVILSGEAYFKVAKGSRFDVITTEGTVSVLGTQFNVKQRDNYFEVTCYEGKVAAMTDEIIRKLLPGERFRIYNGRETSDVTIDEFPQWTNNVSTFTQVPFIEVIKELERQYNIQIIYDAVDTSRLFSGGFVNDNIEQALDAISSPLDLTYEILSTKKVRLFRVDQ